MTDMVALGLDHDGVRLLQLSLLLAIGTIVEKDKDSPEMKKCIESLERYFDALGPDGVQSLAQALIRAHESFHADKKEVVNASLN